MFAYHHRILNSITPLMWQHRCVFYLHLSVGCCSLPTVLSVDVFIVVLALSFRVYLGPQELLEPE